MWGGRCRRAGGDRRRADRASSSLHTPEVTGSSPVRLGYVARGVPPRLPLELRFGAVAGDRLTFVLDHEAHGFVHGPTILTLNHNDLVMNRQNGIEALALANLREDLLALISQGGSLCFGDHDFGAMVRMDRRHDEIEARLDLPSEDIWDVRVAVTETDYRNWSWPSAERRSVSARWWVTAAGFRPRTWSPPSAYGGRSTIRPTST